jgi:glycosyltransferase involved in cell wall biosynthesis
MKQAGLLHVFPSFAVGGQQTRFATIANRLGGAFRHRIVSLDGRDAALALLNPELDARLLQALPPGPARLRRIAQCFGEADAAILLTYNWGAIEWAIANRLFYHWPHFHFEDGFGPEEADHQKYRRVLTRSLVLRRSQVVVPARNLARIATAAWHLDPARVHFIPNGIDPTRFDGLPAHTEFFARRPDERIIGSFSPLRAEKNIGRLLSAFAALGPLDPPVRLVICGDGPERGRLEETAAALGIAEQVVFTGHVPRPEAVMGAFDLLAMTSDTEQMPYAVIEAMAARLPIVATDVGDISVMVAPENRPFIVPRDDGGQLVEALRRLCDDSELRRRIGRRNRERVESEFTIKRMADAFHQLLRAAIASRSSPPASAPTGR